MGRIYSAEHIISSAAQVDFLELLANATVVLKLRFLAIEQDSEFADAQAEMMGLLFIKATGSFTSGSGGGGAPLGHSGGAGTTDATAEILNTTQAVVGLGAFTDIFSRAFNLQIGFFLQQPDIELLEISPSEALIVAATKAPTDSVDWKVSATWEELGGG